MSDVGDTSPTVEDCLHSFYVELCKQSLDGNEAAKQTLKWTGFESDEAEVMMSVPDSPEGFMEFSVALGRTLELFFLARAFHYLEGTGKVPTHLNLKLEASMEAL